MSRFSGISITGLSNALSAIEQLTQLTDYRVVSDIYTTLFGSHVRFTLQYLVVT